MSDAPTLKIVTLNVERSKHLDRVIPFLEQEQPDVFCVQELCSADISKFRDALGAECFAEQLTIHGGDGTPCFFDIGVFTRLPVVKYETRYYYGSPEKVPTFVEGDSGTINRALLCCDVVKDGVTFRIGTTHFTWTADGEADEAQRQDIEQLFEVLKEQGELVFTGDFNAPRGKEIFTRIAEKYCDNVPPEYTTSIDGSLHRAGQLPYMVDGIFSTSGYAVSNVRMVCGVSDHCALVAQVEKGG